MWSPKKIRVEVKKSFMSARTRPVRPHAIVVADGDAPSRAWIRAALAGAFVLDEVPSGSVALEWLAGGHARIMSVGQKLDDMWDGATRARGPLAGQRSWCGDVPYRG